jgi:hypothetical protein
MRVMRGKVALLFIGLGIALPGCTLARNVTEQLVLKPAQAQESFLERRRNRRAAEDVWREVRAANPNLPYSDDYAAGFTDGFADYLYAGGTGEPPLLPPLRYRRLRYQSAEGYQAKLDWFAGFRHGAAVARDGSYRQWVTGPSSLSGPAPPGPPPEPAGLAPLPEFPAPETLPYPKPAPAPTAVWPGGEPVALRPAGFPPSPRGGSAGDEPGVVLLRLP